MLNILNANKLQTFGYQNISDNLTFPAQLDSLGWQLRTENYISKAKWRLFERGNCIFQYTIAGSGILCVNGTEYKLTPGMAFLVTIPDYDYYYLPETSSSWEFIFVTLNGEYTIQTWKSLITTYGNIITISKNSPFNIFLSNFYNDACKKKYNTAYAASTAAYTFLMNLQHQLTQPTLSIYNNQFTANTISKSIQFMKDHISTNITLDEIADHVNMSKYYYVRTFKKYYNISPWIYFIKLRIEYATKLLTTTELAISEVASMCGFDNTNYFCKVFRKYIGMSANQFRATHYGLNDFTLHL